jgi:tRNA threonylcarbamoyladenosine biosynthesis protein TsaE
LRALGYAGKVKSPTFTLVEPYTESRLPLYHFDLYRFKDPNEWRASGFGEYFDGISVCLVEWPERAGDSLPPPDLRIALAHARNGRDATIAAHTDAGRLCLGRLRERYA